MFDGGFFRGPRGPLVGHYLYGFQLKGALLHNSSQTPEGQALVKKADFSQSADSQLISLNYATKPMK